MRRLFVIGSVSMAFTTAVACASSEEVASSNEVEPSGSIPDASVREVAVGADATEDARAPLCNADGWCETVLPDPNLVLVDVWPLEDRAFAIAESYSSGIKVLEWTSTDSTWRYIDDNSQNEEKVAAELATTIWSPNADEVYYAVAPGTIFHGRRPVAPATAWTWTSRKLADNNPSKVGLTQLGRNRLTLGVWGTDGSDVYAWFSNTIFRKSGEGDAIEWLPEYVADDFDAPDEQLFITGLTKRKGGELSFAGARHRANKSCGFVGRKTADGYRRIADGVLPEAWGPCIARADVPLVFGDLWPRQLHSLAGDRLLALTESSQVRLLAPADGGHAILAAPIPMLNDVAPNWRSMWVASDDRQWLLGHPHSGRRYAAVVWFERVWEAGAPYQISSIAQNGAPIDRAPNAIRGTSTSNIWVVGDDYAFHKATP